jgi:hypothetical protein
MSRKKKRTALRRSALPLNIQWMFDIDYLDKLNDEELDWLCKFTEEYYHARVKRGDRVSLHKGAQITDCFGRKNRQNRDLLSIMDSRGGMDRIQPAISTELVETCDECGETSCACKS